MNQCRTVFIFFIDKIQKCRKQFEKNYSKSLQNFYVTWAGIKVRALGKIFEVFIL